jgi:hypothetical protein
MMPTWSVLTRVASRPAGPTLALTVRPDYSFYRHRASSEKLLAKE